MSANNPYQPPQQPFGGYGGPMHPGQSPGQDEYGMAMPQILESLRRTQPWITMFAIMSFLGAGIMVLGGIAMMAAGSTMRGPMPVGPALGLVYLVLAAFYGVVGKFLWGYRSGIEQFTATQGSPSMLAIALDRQASFWRFLGILTLVMIGLYVVLIFAMVAGMAAAFR